MVMTQCPSMKRTLVGALAALVTLAGGVSVASAQSYGSATYGESANFSQWDRVAIVTRINVRSSANGSIIGKQSTGATGTLVGGPEDTGGSSWWGGGYA